MHDRGETASAGGPAGGDEGRRRGGRAGALLLVAALVLAVVAHLPALDNGFTNWDDPHYLIDNALTWAPLGQGVEALLLTPALAYPVPVTVLAYAAERAAFGIDPSAFHAASLGLHLLVVLLAALLARRLGTTWAGAAAAAAVLAVHPLTVEPVAWVVGQKDLLATAFMLAALTVRAGPRGDAAAPSVAVVLLTLVSLAAKPSTVLAPLLILGVDLVCRRRPGRPGAIAVYLATAAMGAAAVVLAIRGHHNVEASSVERVGLHSLELAAWALQLQVSHLLWPDALVARYFAPAGLELHVLAATGAVLGVALAAAVVIAWRRDRRAVAFGVAAALMAYAPAGGIIPLVRGPADSYLYLPLALAVVALGCGLGRVLDGPARWTTPAAIGLAGALAAMVFATRAQADVWRDSITLWSALAAEYPDEPAARTKVAVARIAGGDVAGGLATYDAIERDLPGYLAIDVDRGTALAALGRIVEADRALSRAVTRVDDPAVRETYGFFLVGREIEPADADAARRALVEVAPLLARRGKRPASVRRAIALCDRLGLADHASALRRRLAELEAR